MDNTNINYNKLNDDWINEFEKTDKLYQDFYKDDLYYINLKYVYINSNNEIEKINQETFLLSGSNKLTREEMLKILKRSRVVNNLNYSLLSILRYNICIDALDIKHFLLYPTEFDKYISVIKNIDAISFEKRWTRKNIPILVPRKFILGQISQMQLLVKDIIKASKKDIKNNIY